MSEADDAFAAAEAVIEKARVEGTGLLILSGKDLNALTRLPDSIGGLIGLQTLTLFNTQVSDLTPLQALTGLQALSLFNTQVSDLTPLQAHTGLHTLSVNNTQVTDLATLQALTGLKSLSLNNTPVSDLTPLQALTGLQTLTLFNTQVSDLVPLQALTRLQTLSLNNTPVSDLVPLQALTRLHTLTLDKTRVSDLTPLQPLTGLKSLSLNNTPVSDLTPLLALTGLQTLTLFNTQVSDLVPLQALTRLQRLDLDNTQVSDLNPLQALTGLQTLSLNNTPVSDLVPLQALTGLQTLDLRRTKVADFRPLRSLRKLVQNPKNGGLSFSSGAANSADARIGEIAKIKGLRERAGQLFAYLEDWVPPGDGDIEEILKGPILSESLVDVRNTGATFEAVSVADEASRARDRSHDELIATLIYAATRLGQTETENRIGRETAQSLRDYAGFAGQVPPNPRLLIYLAQGLRAVLSDDDLNAALDGFDLSNLSDMLDAHDQLIRGYYADAQAMPLHEVTADPETLEAELFPKLKAARDLVAEADANGLFAPSVGVALDMMNRRAEGARKTIQISADPEEKQRAVADLRRTAVLVTAYLGRIKARVQVWVDEQVEFAKENPGNATLTAVGLVEVGKQVVAAVTPVFNALWKLIGNLPLPF